MEPDETEIKEAMNYHRSVLIAEYVKDKGLIKLINDYSQFIDYYYDVTNKILYKVNNICDETMLPLPHFIIVEDKHILEMNGIESINNNDI